jgi:hypothetical protein
MKALENLEWHGRWVTDLACLKSCLDYLHVDVSDAWLYGACGHAFALNIHEALCPSGPTAWKKQRIHELAENVGCTIRTLTAFNDAPDFAEQQRAVWQQVTAAIDQDLPCYGWELDIPEYYIIFGYDDGNYLYSGCTQDRGSKPWQQLGDTGIGVIEIHIVDRGQARDERQTVREALGFAIEHSHAPAKWLLGPKYQCGLAGYDQWIGALETGRVSTGPMAFNTQVWGECRQKACEFLREAKLRLADDGDSLLDEAIRRFKVVAEAFARLRKRFVFEPEQWHQAITDHDRLTWARECLCEARDAETKALAEFEKITTQL